VSWSGPVAGNVTFGFDSSFRLVSRAVNGQALALGYDADSLLTSSGALTITRDPQNGRLTGTTLGAVTDAYTYDANGLLSSYVASYSGNPLYTESVQRTFSGASRRRPRPSERRLTCGDTRTTRPEGLRT